ncbi:PAS domain S-box protein [uncultured Nitrospira sp.]|uniref:PAS domain S-box protein n=1 Tax=uncultured Nitrospira sp. TaxID=157176 RepID=UPI00314048F4
MSEDRFRSLFEGVALSIWEEDFTDVKALIETLYAGGVRDFRGYFTEHPEVVERAIGLVRILDVNPAAVTMFGAVSRAELLQSLHHIFVPETGKIFLEELVAIAEHRKFFESEVMLKTLRGEYITAIFTIAFPSEDQAFNRVVVTVADMTVRKRAEDALRESEERFARFMQHLPGLAWIKDLQGRYVYANETAEQVFHTPCERLYGRTDEDLFPEEVAACFRENDRQALVTEKGVQVVETLRHRDGVLHHAIVNKFPILGTDGRPILIGGMAVDITKRKQAEKALLESETEARRLLKLNQTIMGNMGEGMYTVDTEGLVTYVNPEAERMFGWKSSELLGRMMHDITHFKYPDGTPFPIEECAGFQVRRHGKILRNFEDTFIRKDGSFFPVSYSASPLRDHEDEIIGLVIVFQDITERKQTEEELRRWKDELEIRVNERTRELVSSQDRLRSLASQLILTEEHERRKLARDLHDYLVQLLVVGCLKLDQMKNILTLSSETEVAIQDLREILQQALSYSRTTIAELSPPNFHEAGLPMALKWLTERMEKHGLGVEIHTSDQTIHLSENRVILLFQSVRELLLNVLKHAGVQKASVRMVVEPDGEVCIAVEDRGTGLDADAMQRAKDPGHLGLFAVQERMEAMGGRVEVLSVPGEGTCVKLLLPAYEMSDVDAGTDGKSGRLTEKASPQERMSVNAAVVDSIRTRQHSPRPRVRVLLVDDHAMFRKGMQKLLERYEELEIVGEASDGAEAVMLASQLIPDVVVMGNHMPKLNGIEATRQICRELPAIKVIGLSMNDAKEIRETMLEAGAIEYLQKNGSVKELYEAISSLFPNQT